ncbi:MAG TPA: hypothetical protein VHH91_03200, partial [Vicinamibacterales bacterium]|nr:hypothetical protein [Vicinamibacterales bacterium]
MRAAVSSLLVSCGCLVWTAGLDAQGSGPATAVPQARGVAPTAAPTVRAIRSTSPMSVDGVLDEPIYAATPAIGGFVQQEPFEYQPATEQTEAWIFFDERNIYVSARCWESHPERRVANEMRRDTSQLRQND